MGVHTILDTLEMDGVLIYYHYSGCSYIAIIDISLLQERRGTLRPLTGRRERCTPSCSCRKQSETSRTLRSWSTTRLQLSDYAQDSYKTTQCMRLHKANMFSCTTKTEWNYIDYPIISSRPSSNSCPIIGYWSVLETLDISSIKMCRRAKLS